MKHPGIFFPKGTKVMTHAKHASLTVVGTPELLGRVEQFVKDTWKALPRTLAFTVHIVEADADTLRPLYEAATQEEKILPVQPWAEVEKLREQGQAMVVDVFRLEGNIEEAAEMATRVDADHEYRIWIFPTLFRLQSDIIEAGFGLSVWHGKEVASFPPTLVSGAPRMVALWEPKEKPASGKPKLRAAFLRADVLPIDPTAEP